ncbi:MAG: hypothetical protein NW207_11980 [Cytophagales bacterium]|nr:hypothetical protein [Cytophagales bacterium]
MMKKHVFINIIYFLALVILIGGCGDNKTPEPRNINLFFNVVDDNNKNVAGAQLYLFNTEADVNASIASMQALNAIDSTQSNSNATGTNAQFAISSDKMYWLYIKYNDNFRKLTLTNEGFSNTINKLPKDLDVTVKIRLSPINGNIAFWSPDVNIFPITIQFEKQTYNFATSGEPENALSPVGLIVNRRAGAFKYYAKNDHGCVWTGTIDLKKGEFKTIQIQKCSVGELVFWSEEINKTFMPITIILNNADTLATLNSYTSGFVCGNTDNSILKTYREQGSYTYFATASNGTCIWTGTFDLNTDQCTAVKLDACK